MYLVSSKDSSQPMATAVALVGTSDCIAKQDASQNDCEESLPDASVPF